VIDGAASTSYGLGRALPTAIGDGRRVAGFDLQPSWVFAASCD
jgi:hypothetical protein